MNSALITGVLGSLGRRLVGALADGRAAGRIIGIHIVPPVDNNANPFFHCMDIRLPPNNRWIKFCMIIVSRVTIRYS